jgi:hypothetical protein
MVVCPVCEHAQAGRWECEVCGRRLEADPDAPPPGAALDGLESTLQAPAPEAPPEVVPGLEPTGAPALPAPAAGLLAEIESTRTSPVDPPVAPLPGVERAADGVPAEERTPYPAVVVCRYCRTEAMLGARICERCGMRLPTAEPPAPEPEADAARLCSCGTPVRGSLCPSCGARTR